jgi:SAM-dependent methyltransferase
MSDYIHKEHPKTVGKTEFWKQIKRTVNGQEVSEKDIDAIIFQIKNNLLFNRTDELLDFGCGNGALASRLFPLISHYSGVDFSQYLLDIAKEYFQPTDKVNYYFSDIISFLNTKFLHSNPTKILIYGVMAYLTREEVSYLFSKMMESNGLQRVFIGNIPNSSFAKEFYLNREITDYDLNDAKSEIGVWWDPIAICKIAEEVGFTTKVLTMPSGFYSAHYRFDLVLEKNQ